METLFVTVHYSASTALQYSSDFRGTIKTTKPTIIVYIDYTKAPGFPRCDSENFWEEKTLHPPNEGHKIRFCITPYKLYRRVPLSPIRGPGQNLIKSGASDWGLLSGKALMPPLIPTLLLPEGENTSLWGLPMGDDGPIVLCEILFIDWGVLGLPLELILMRSRWRACDSSCICTDCMSPTLTDIRTRK